MRSKLCIRTTCLNCTRTNRFSFVALTLNRLRLAIDISSGLVAEHEEGTESCSATLQVKLTLRSDQGKGAIANRAQKTRTEVIDRV
jgi:hypothetical protein